MEYEKLRKKYPRFVYESYFYNLSKNNLEIFFNFKIEPDIFFTPQIVFENVKKEQINRLAKEELNNLIFNLGLIEIPSYWKATCSPLIEIKAGFLNKIQIKWWKNLILKGMGQFFYENKINFTKKDFLQIKVSNFLKENFLYQGDLKDRFLVPVGGGKDSIVTIEKLKKEKKEIACFLVNPTKEMLDVVKMAKIKDKIIVKRKIDKKLLELNKKGFLNGHTPITAVISFLGVLAGILFDFKNLVFSNEKSSDEGNVKYLGKIINHQWSKSSEFEKMFSKYCQKYLAKKLNYFSLLRKYSSLEIIQEFIKYPQYFYVFSSCNVKKAKKLKRKWCGNCPKCLFLFALLYPFLDKKKLIKIFGEDLFEKKELLETMKSLILPKKTKPFECVGTKKENFLIFKLALKKAKERSEKLPFLLRYFENI